MKGGDPLESDDRTSFRRPGVGVRGPHKSVPEGYILTGPLPWTFRSSLRKSTQLRLKKASNSMQKHQKDKKRFRADKRREQPQLGRGASSFRRTARPRPEKGRATRNPARKEEGPAAKQTFSLCQDYLHQRKRTLRRKKKGEGGG